MVFERTCLLGSKVKSTLSSPKKYILHREEWLRGRALVSRLREPEFKSCAVVRNLGQVFFTRHCSLSCMNEYLVINSGGCLYA